MRQRNVALLFLGLGTILFALAPPLLKLLTNMGGRLGLQMPGAISFCNVLFVGNFCAGLVTLAVYGVRPIFRELRQLSRRAKGSLLLASIVATLYPALLFTGLERTTVINVVLLSRFNGIVLVILGYLFLKTMVRKAEVVGYAVIAAGVIALIVIGNGGLRIMSGEMFILLAAVFFALTEILSHRVLEECTIRTYVFFRNISSSLIFFAVAVYLFGFEHFSEAFTGELWVVMVLYAGLAVVAAQVFWLKATKVLPVQTVANSQLINPALTIVFAFLLLKEVPHGMEWVAMGVILVGMLIPRLARIVPSARSAATLNVETSLAGR